MLPGMELMGCPMAIPAEVMHHVVRVESSYNPYAIGVVGAHLARQPRNLVEALATVRMLESRGYNFSLGLAQVNRYNLAKYGLGSYEKAFEVCPNLQAGARILTECYHRAGGDWGKSFSCYYSGNFVTGYRHGYVQKIYASMRGGTAAPDPGVPAIQVVSKPSRRAVSASQPRPGAAMQRVTQRIAASERPPAAWQGAATESHAQTPVAPPVDATPTATASHVQDRTRSGLAPVVPTVRVPEHLVPTAAPQPAQPSQAGMAVAAPTQSTSVTGDAAFVF